jgi:hypothetical protein
MTEGVPSSFRLNDLVGLVSREKKKRKKKVVMRTLG